MVSVACRFGKQQRIGNGTSDINLQPELNIVTGFDRKRYRRARTTRNALRHPEVNLNVGQLRTPDVWTTDNSSGFTAWWAETHATLPDDFELAVWCGGAGARRLTADALALAHDPDRYIRPFSRRHDSALPFDPRALPAGLPLMLGTTVYVHRLQNKIPPSVHALVEARPVLHCAVAIAEIAISVGIMDPTHATTAHYRTSLLGLLGGISTLDMRAPGPDASAEAGMLAGILTRTQCGLAQPRTALASGEAEQQRESRRRLLNDALICLCAGEHGAILISGNVTDMDILLRFRPDSQVLLYRAWPRGDRSHWSD